MDAWLIILLVIAILLLFIPLLFLLGGVIYRRTSRECHYNSRLEGKTAIVTGSSAGIGRQTAMFLAKRGARVVMACRNTRKAKAVADVIKYVTNNENVVVREVNLSDLSSVRQFATRIIQEEPALHMLINNAGILSTGEKKVSAQGYELTLATNHYGAFLLTNLLIDKLRGSAPSRVVTVSSVGYKLNVLDVQDLSFKKRKFGNTTAYCQSKLCNILFTKELAVRLQGTGVTANCCHPGFVSTDIFNGHKTRLGRVFSRMTTIIARTPELGAQTTNYLAVSEEVEGISGCYYDNCRKRKLQGKANDMELASNLWDISTRDVGLIQTEALM